MYNGVMTRVYDEIVDFIAGGSTPEAVVAWKPSAQSRERVEQLLASEKAGTLTAEERGELTHYLELEHLMPLAKARARQARGHE
jgi:hypothetical protein